MKAKFIVIEGLEGAGKTTAMDSVISTLQRYGVEQITCTREPGGTALGEKLRALVKQEQEEPLEDMTELLLMYASRVQLVARVIRPALEQGIWVVGDRHDLSSQAYQGGGRQISASILTGLRDMALGDFKPDLTLYLDIDPQIGLQRVRGRGELDRIEQMDLSFFERTRARYLDIAAQDSSILVINAQQTPSIVAQEIQYKLGAWLAQQKGN